MSRYRIGRISGPWVNFVPPIQGGSFRQIRESASASLPPSESSSRRSSFTESPTFEPRISLDRMPARRTYGRSVDDTETSSISSVSSLGELCESLKKETSDLPDLTQKEVDFDLGRYPSLDPETQASIVARYRQLNQTIHDAGLYKCNYGAYAKECCRYAFLFGLSLWLLHFGWYGASGFFLACFWHQLVFTAHDAGHMGITHNFTIDTIIGVIIADFLGGLSLGWWKRNHNVHHIVTNSPEHDPDIEHMPFFAVSHRFFESLKSTYYDRVMTFDSFAKIVIPLQHYLYYPLLAFGRFNLYRLSWEYLILGLGPKKGPAWWHRWLELAGQMFFGHGSGTAFFIRAFRRQGIDSFSSWLVTWLLRSFMFKSL